MLLSTCHLSCSPISFSPHIIHQTRVFGVWCCCLPRHSSGSPLAITHKRFPARTRVMSLPLVQSDAYYTITSDRYGSSIYLSDGTIYGNLSLTNMSFGSNNWQIFYQDPIYLIRNWVYGSKLQLGIAASSPTIPTLMIASGNLTQQWSLTQWADGTYRLANIWLGSGQVLGVSHDTNDEVIPRMTATQDESHWSLTINPSGATSNLTADMLQPMPLQAVR